MAGAFDAGELLDVEVDEIAWPSAFVAADRGCGLGVEVIETVQPLLSNHFNLTVELPLKAIVRGHTYAVVPISWTNRRAGTSKLSLQEMGSRYLFIVLYVFLERHLSRGDYRREQARETHKPA